MDHIPNQTLCTYRLRCINYDINNINVNLISSKHVDFQKVLARVAAASKD